MRRAGGEILCGRTYLSHGNTLEQQLNLQGVNILWFTLSYMGKGSRTGTSGGFWHNADNDPVGEVLVLQQYRGLLGAKVVVSIFIERIWRRERTFLLRGRAPREETRYGNEQRHVLEACYTELTCCTTHQQELHLGDLENCIPSG